MGNDVIFSSDFVREIGWSIVLLRMTVKNLVDELNLKVITGNDLEREVDGCYIGDLLSWVMSKAQQNNVWITVQTNLNIVAVAALTEVSAIIIPENIQVEEQTIKKADSQNIIILSSEMNSYQLAKKIG